VVEEGAASALREAECGAGSRPRPRRLRTNNTARVYARCTFSLLGERGEGVVFSRPLRALRARRESSEASFARRSTMARFTPFTEAMEMRSAWCDTNERREWGGYAVRSTPER